MWSYKIIRIHSHQLSLLFRLFLAILTKHHHRTSCNTLLSLSLSAGPMPGHGRREVSFATLNAATFFAQGNDRHVAPRWVLLPLEAMHFAWLTMSWPHPLSCPSNLQRDMKKKTKKISMIFQVAHRKHVRNDRLKKTAICIISPLWRRHEVPICKLYMQCFCSYIILILLCVNKRRMRRCAWNVTFASCEESKSNCPSSIATIHQRHHQGAAESF